MKKIYFEHHAQFIEKQSRFNIFEFHKNKKNKKICLFIIKNISMLNLNIFYKFKNFMTIKIRLNQQNDQINYLQIHNFYNEFKIKLNSMLTDFKTILNEKFENETLKHLIIKNFNIHNFI